MQSRTIEWAAAFCRANTSSSRAVSGSAPSHFDETDGMTFTANTASWAVRGAEGVHRRGINKRGCRPDSSFPFQYGGMNLRTGAERPHAPSICNSWHGCWRNFRPSTRSKPPSEACASSRWKDVGRTLAHRRTVRTAGRAEIVGGSAAFLRKRGRCAHQRPGFGGQLTNLNNYVNLYPGDAPSAGWTA